jgi:lipopolysaccharide biosynthesis regulator YciM
MKKAQFICEQAKTMANSKDVDAKNKFMKKYIDMA